MSATARTVASSRCFCCFCCFIETFQGLSDAPAGCSSSLGATGGREALLRVKPVCLQKTFKCCAAVLNVLGGLHGPYSARRETGAH
jgi:hypothetical protein